MTLVRICTSSQQTWNNRHN